jgi:hypothetical protein
VLVGGILDAAVREVAVRLRLVDGVDRAEAHRDRRELPELGHEPRVRIRRQAARRVRLLLAETRELLFAQAALEVGAGVHAGGGVTLVEDLVAATGVVLAAEEPVVPDLVEGGGGGVGGDVPADGDAGALSPVHGDRGVPADPRPVAALDLFVTGEGGLVLGRDRVDVVRRGHHRHPELQVFRALQQAQHDVATATAALRAHEGVERLLPFGGLVRVLIGVIDRIRVLVVDGHR